MVERLPLWTRLRQWLASGFFRMAGFFDPAYDVWLDEAPLRHPRKNIAKAHREDTDAGLTTATGEAQTDSHPANRP